MPPEDNGVVALVAAPEIVAPVATEVPSKPISAKMPSLDEIAAQLAAANKKVTSSETEVVTDEAPVVAVGDKPADPVVEVVKPEVKPPNRDSDRFAALTRREQEARRREGEAKQRVKDLETRQRELEERETRIKGAKSPLEVLKAHGLTYQDATMEAVGAYRPKETDPFDTKVQSALDPVNVQVAELKKQLDEATGVVKQLQADRVAAIQHQVMHEFKQAAEQGGYEYVLAFGQEALNLAKDIALKHKAQYGRLLTYNESLDIVEGYYSKRADAIAATKKFQSRSTSTTTNPTPSKPTNPVAPAKTSTDSAAKPNPGKTLTQSHSQTNRSRPDLDKMPERDALDWIAANVLKTVEK